MLAWLHVNKGGTCLGPDLEIERAGNLRRVCIRRRGLAGGILEFRIQTTPTNKPVSNQQPVTAPESTDALRCFVF